MHASIPPCFHVFMFSCFYVSMLPCFHVSILPFFHVSMPPYFPIFKNVSCFYVSILPYFHASILPLALWRSLSWTTLYVDYFLFRVLYLYTIRTYIYTHLLQLQFQLRQSLDNSTLLNLEKQRQSRLYSHYLILSGVYIPSLTPS